jgi:hypothetical protein
METRTHRDATTTGDLLTMTALCFGTKAEAECERSTRRAENTKTFMF